MNTLESIQLNLRIKYLNNVLNACIKQNINTDIINNELTKLKNQEIENNTMSV